MFVPLQAEGNPADKSNESTVHQTRLLHTLKDGYNLAIMDVQHSRFCVSVLFVESDQDWAAECLRV